MSAEIDVLSLWTFNPSPQELLDGILFNLPQDPIDVIPGTYVRCKLVFSIIFRPTKAEITGGPSIRLAFSTTPAQVSSPILLTIFNDADGVSPTERPSYSH